MLSVFAIFYTHIKHNIKHISHPAMQLILDIVKRCHYFIASAQLREQLISIEIMTAAFVRLATNRYVLE